MHDEDDGIIELDEADVSMEGMMAIGKYIYISISLSLYRYVYIYIYIYTCIFREPPLGHVGLVVGVET